MPSINEAEVSWTSSGLDFLVCLDRHGQGFGAALQQAVRDAIRSGRLHQGHPVPSTRALASDLGVARGTVVEAYEQLIAEGWLVARQEAVTRVAHLPSALPAPAEPSAVPALLHDLRPGHADPSSFVQRERSTVFLCIGARGANVRIFPIRQSGCCLPARRPGSGCQRLPQTGSSAAGREGPWPCYMSGGGRELCQPKTEADGKPSRRAP
jgi:hypothetical protein